MSEAKHQSEYVDRQVLSALEETLGSNSANQIIKEFLDLAKATITQTIEDLDNKDYDAFAKGCHTIKSNIAYLGGKKLEKMCMDIEEICADGRFEEIDAMANDFKVCCTETISILESD